MRLKRKDEDLMDTQFIIEAVGYIGSAIVLVSFLMTSVFRLRVVNTAGSLIFMVYALIIHSYPTAIMNLCLALINIRFLWKMRHTGREYELVRVERNDSFLQYLLETNREDIEACFPGVETEPRHDDGGEDACYIITCRQTPAGIVLGRMTPDGTLDMQLDYSLPEYRDFSIGEFLSIRLRKEGVRKLTYAGPDANHMAYLNELEFKSRDGIYEKELIQK